MSVLHIGPATLHCARSRPMVDGWVAALEAEPERWLPAAFVRWLGKAGEWWSR